MDNSCCHPLKTRRPKPRKPGTPTRQIVTPWPVALTRAMMLKMSSDDHYGAPALRGSPFFEVASSKGRTRFALEDPPPSRNCQWPTGRQPLDALTRAEPLPQRNATHHGARRLQDKDWSRSIFLGSSQNSEFKVR